MKEIQKFYTMALLHRDEEPETPDDPDDCPACGCARGVIIEMYFEENDLVITTNGKKICACESKGADEYNILSEKEVKEFIKSYTQSDSNLVDDIDSAIENLKELRDRYR